MRFSPSPSCRGDAANPWLESAFITHVGCLSRHLVVCSQSIAIACVSCRVSPLLVFPAEYRHCLCFFCWFSQSTTIACVFLLGFHCRQLMMILQCISSQVFVGQKFWPCSARSPRSSLVLERSVMLDWRRMPVSSGAVHRQHVFCSHGHVSWHVVPRRSGAGATSVVGTWAIDAAHDGHSRRTPCRAGGHRDDRSRRTCCHGEGPAIAGDGAGDAAGDGAGDDKPAEPCTKRRKTHVPPEVREWFCSLARVKPDWTMTQCFRFAKRALPSFFEQAHIEPPRKWFSHKTPGTALGRPRSLEPAAVPLADIVSRVCSRVCCGAGVLAELLNAHLETLGIAYRFSTRQSRKFMRSLGYSFKKPNGMG